MAPVLNQQLSKRDGLAFIGLSLTRKSNVGHPDSITHQTAFDFNDIVDREYDFVASTDDAGWLVSGGEPGPPNSYKLPAKDSAHVEIMRIGTLRPEWGGITEKGIIEAMTSGKILIPQVEVLPTGVVPNSHSPPELEVRFDMKGETDFDDLKAPLPVNWQLRFIHNQLFKYFSNPSRFCPGAFHMTILRKAEFRSQDHKDAYFSKADAVLKKWKLNGPRALNDGAWGIDGKTLDKPGAYNSGIFLFQDRNTIKQFFPPNFLPPYDTDEKLAIILNYLSEEWDQSTLSWRTVKEKKVKEIAEADDSAGPSQFIDNLCGQMGMIPLGPK